MLYIPMEIAHYFGGIYFLHLKGQKALPVACFILDCYLPPECWLSFTEVHSVILLKTELVIATAVRTLSPPQLSFSALLYTHKD
jgi:hypothetical protein